MLNRFKLLVLAIILAILTILFFQNQESLSLKFFCSDATSEYCFYQTPSISLAIWMAIFMLLGAISSLGWQLLQLSGNSTQRDRKSSGRASRPSQTATNYRNKSNSREETEFKSAARISSDNINPNNPRLSDWEQRKSEDWETATSPNFAKDDVAARTTPRSKAFDMDNPDKRPKYDESNRRAPRVSQTQPGGSSKESSNPQSPKASVSKNAEEVYDASYRALNDVPPPSVPQGDMTEDEDPDWI